jgi:hypothetical protein
VAALAAVGVLLLTRGSPPHTPAGAGSGSPAGHASSAASTPAQTTSPRTTPAQATQAAGATIPAAFAGTWRGTATMSAIGVAGPSLTNAIQFTFRPGGRTAHEIDQDCVNTLTLTGATATVLTFSEPQTASCVAGTVTFTRHGAGLAYRWTDNIEQNVATLRKA